LDNPREHVYKIKTEKPLDFSNQRTRKLSPGNGDLRWRAAGGADRENRSTDLSFRLAFGNRIGVRYRQIILRELGYIEGKNIIIEWRQAGGKLDRLAGFAEELVRLKVDVILTAGSTATGAAKQATNTIPIVMLQDNDPVGSGFINSLARPGGNITGLSTLRPEISGKRLELLKEVVPGLSRVAVLGSSNNPGNAEGLKETELAAAAFKLQIHYLDVRALKDIEPAFRDARTGRADAMLVLGGPIFTVRRKELAAHAIKSRLPAIYVRQNFVTVGGLMSYGVNLADLQRRAAIYVDKILKGAKPADLPVEQPRKFELVINLKTAKQIGLTIPPNVLARADRVIR
jgi:putative ABC transport system substrate-binding protein